MTIRIKFERYAGRTVLHCHNLDHEDQGMMMKVHIVDPAAKPKRAGLPKLPTAAPPWALRDSAKQSHAFSKFAGQNIVLVFVQDFACSHCQRQLQAFAQRQKALADAKLTVVAIGPNSCEAIDRAIQATPLTKRLPFVLLSDPSLDAFRKYGCTDDDGRALHGTFLIDARGTVRWQHVGDEPYMEIDRLLNEQKKRVTEAASR